MLRVRSFAVFLCIAFALCLTELWSVQSQSSLRRLTNTTEEGISLNPSLSGDGRSVAFETTEDVAQVGGTDFFRAIRADVSADPPTFTQMGRTRAPAPALSQDGSRIAFASKDNPLGTNQDGNSEIYLFDASVLRQITNTSPGDITDRVRNGNFQPSISDDGRFIAFSSNRDLAGLNADGNLEIFIYDGVSQTFTQITNAIGTVGSTDAKISGDGSRVAFIRDRGATLSTQRDLLLHNRTPGTTQVIGNNVPGLALTYGRAISDDGTRVVYSAETATNSRQVLLFDGRSLNLTRPITFLGALRTDVPLHPTISGDGSRIAFATMRKVANAIGGDNTDDSVELYTFDIPTAEFARVTPEFTATEKTKPVTEVVSSLNDQGTIIAFNFPRVISGPTLFPESANNSEIYVTATPARPGFGNLLVLNGASFGNEPSSTKAVAPNSIAVGLGGDLAKTTEQAQRQQNGTFPTNVGGTTVRVNGRLAQIFFVSPSQVNFLVPAETEIGIADVVITNANNFETRGKVTVLRAAPGVFTFSGDGRGEGVILDADTLQPGPFDPSNGQRRLIVFATGVRNATQVTVQIGGRFVTVESVVPSSNLPGLDEIHLLLPADLRGAGMVELVVRADGRDSNPVTVTITGDPQRNIVINELLADPPDGIAGDANHDGVRDSNQDEFVEIVNATDSDIDISGFELSARGGSGSSDTLRHKFAPNTILPARGAIVVFGGGNFDPNNPVFGGAQVVKASTGSLSLVNNGGVVTLRDTNGGVVSLLSYGGSTGINADANQSVTRSPDVTGGFTGHLSAEGNGGRAFSPGTRVDGSPFLSPAIARIEVSPASATIFTGQQQQFTAQAFDSNGNVLSGVIFVWQSSNPAVATINQNGIATGVSEGTTEIRASARGVQSAPATLTVNFVPRVLTRIEVTPSQASIPVGGGQQFTARAFDQFNNEITGVSFTWSSSDTGIATIDQTGLALGVSQGQTTITASAQNVSGTATLNVTPPTVVINEVLADPPDGIAGDANHDGVRSGADDEFIELVNSTGGSINISGWTVSTRGTTETLRHTFAANTTLPAGEAIVVFGGGNFNPNNPAFACAQVVKASSGGLSLTNSGLTITVRDSAGNLVTQFTYGTGTSLAADNDQSLTRSPDITGSFVQHTTATGAGGRRFSPGAKVNGAPFGSCPARLTSITISPPSANVLVGQSTQFTAQAFDQFGNPITGATITFASDNPSVATVDSVTTDPATGIATATVTGHTQGTAQITAQSTDGTTTVTSSPATLTVGTPPPTVSEDDVVINEFVVNPTTGKEYVELLVTKPGGVDMRGWTLSDVATRTTSTSSTEGDITLPSLDYLSNVPQGTFVVIVLSAPSSNTNTLAEDTSTGDGNRKLVLIAGVTTGLVTSGTIDLIQNENLQLYGPGGRGTGRVVDQVLVGSNTSYIFAPDGTTVQATFGDNNGATTSDNINGSSSLASNSDVSFCPTADTLSQFQNNDTGSRFTVTANSYGTPGEKNACVANDTSVGGTPPALVINISGRVTDTSGNGVEGVTITVDLEHGGTTDTRTTLTDSNGDYSFTNLPGGQDRVFVTPSKEGFTFNPSRVAFVSSGSVSGDFTANFTASTSTEPLPTITISDAALSEGNSGTKNVGFIVTLSEPSTQTVTVDYATAGAPGSSGVATPDIDYQSRSGTLIFNPGVTSRTIVVPFIGDTLVEPNEIFFVNLFNPTNAFINDSQAIGTIINDDTANLVISQIYGGGGNTGAQFTNDFIEVFNRGTTTVDLAGWSVQYNSATDTDAWAVTPLCANGPCLLAPGHYFLVREGASGTTNLPTPDAVGNIAMTTGTGKVALVTNTTPLSGACPLVNSSVADLVGYGSSASLANFCYEGTGPAPAPSNTTADFRKSGGCTDTNDNAADFLVSAPNPRNSASPANDCSGGPKPDITIDDVTVTEGNSGTINATFTVTLSASSTSSVTVNFATADGTATAGSDYQSNSGTLTFAPGVTTQTITVAVNGDTLDEPNETFFVNLSNATNAVILDHQGQGTITDNDAPPTISINDTSVAEGDNGTTNATFNVSLSAASGQQITVAYSTADGSATAGSDYQSTSGTLTFNAGQTTQTITVLVNGDTTFEPNETFVVNLNTPTNATISDNQGQGTITNDDAAPPVPAFTINDVSVAEGDSGTKTVDFTVTISMNPTTPVTVDYATANGTATAGSDYQSTSGTLTFNPGDPLSKTISVTINGDTLVEPDETFFVNLTNASANSIITDNQGQGTITNDDTANLVISQVYGGGNNSGAPYQRDFIEIFNRGTTTVNFAVTPYSVQYASAGSDFGPSKTDLTSGTIAPGQYFLIQEAGGTTNGIALPAPDATGTIAMGNTSGKVALVVGTTSLPAAICPGDDGNAPFNPNDPTIADFIGYGSVVCYEGSAPAPAPSNTTADFREAGGCTDTNDNAADFFVFAPNPRNSSSPLNNCSGGATPTLSISDATVTEGNSGTVTATFTVSLSSPANGADVIFDIATADGTAQDDVPATEDNDYVARSLTGQTILAGQQTFTFDVTVNGDTTLEPNETFFVNVTNVTGATVTDGQGLGTIQNDDSPPELSINNVTANEGNTGTTTFTFTVSLSAPAKAGGVTFDIATQDDTATVAGNDYTAKSLTSQTIPAGSQTYTFDVAVTGDTIFEPNETFFVNVANVTGATVTDGQGLGTITNDDAQPTITIADAAVIEGNAGTSLMTFTVTLNGTSQSTVSVNYATADSSATVANTDYDSTSGTVNFVPGDTSETFTVTIHGDTQAEGDEMFLVNLSGASGATISDNLALGTIFLDDPLSVASLNTAYSENFDSLAQSGVSSTTPPAWTRAESGTGANFTYTANNGGSATGDTYSYGTTGSSDRALGGLRTGTLVPTIGAFYRNDTGSTINTLQIAYTGEQWRLGTASRTDRLDFQYSTNATSLTTGTWTDVDTLDFTTPNTTTTGAKDGNDAANRTAISSTITGLSIAPGATFWIRWNDFDASGADDGLAVDNFSLTAGINAPTLSINDVSLPEGNSLTTTFSFTVSLSSVALTDVTFDIATQDDTATTADNDYVAKSLTNQKILAGQQTYTFDVTVNGDTNVELTETFFVNVTNVTGATLGDGQGVGTITNDDAGAASADLSVTKTDSPDPAFIGNDITYKITVNNGGPDAAVNAVLADTVPTNTTFRSITTPAGWNCSTLPTVGSTGSISCSNPSFSNGSSVEFDLVVRVDATVAQGTIISNTASVSSDTSDLTTSNDSATTTTTANSPLVITQIYGGGGLTGATYRNDFIEIFNRGKTTIDFSVTPYSVQYADATNAFTTLKTDLITGTIGPGQYFLIQEASGGSNGSLLPTTDAAGTINLNANSGKVALVLGTTALSGTCPGDDGNAPFNPAGAGIVDFVGYGFGTTTGNPNCFEGSARVTTASATANARSILRTVSCTDTNNNSADFTYTNSTGTSPPVARNKLTTAAPCP